uniref:Uncharacterized protein n=1 Tax=Cannabis sativa TaxID=3483 RepID=A0A803PJC5_CANSA
MGNGQSKVDKTPSKVKTRVADLALPLRTPDKYGAGISSARQRFSLNWGRMSKIVDAGGEEEDEVPVVIETKKKKS